MWAYIPPFLCRRNIYPFLQSFELWFKIELVPSNVKIATILKLNSLTALSKVCSPWNASNSLKKDYLLRNFGSVVGLADSRIDNGYQAEVSSKYCQNHSGFQSERSDFANNEVSSVCSFDFPVRFRPSLASTLRPVTRWSEILRHLLLRIWVEPGSTIERVANSSQTWLILSRFEDPSSQFTTQVLVYFIDEIVSE